jgi:hypothetical protein
LHFADEKNRKMYTCSICPEHVKLERKCQSLNYNAFKKPRRIGGNSLEYSFCPAMATWDEEALEVFADCVLAINTNILPEDGHFSSQKESFVKVYPQFVIHWKHRFYEKVWVDISEFTKMIFESLFGKKK